MAFKPFSIFLTIALWSLSTTQLLSSAAPTQINTTQTNTAQTNSSDPCNLLRYIDVQWIPAKDAYACLLAPEFNKGRSKNIYQQIRKFSHLQSAQAFYKNPPKGAATMKISPVDLNVTLDAVEKKLDEGAYRNDYEFTKDLSNVFSAFHDGHTVFYSDCAFPFGEYTHSYPLVSIVDPETDEQKYHVTNFTTGEIYDEIVEIAGQPPIQYLLGLLQSLKGPWETSWIDEDTRWNALFASRGVGLPDYGNFAARDFYPGDGFTMKTRSGQVIEVEWYVQGPLGWSEQSRDWFRTVLQSTQTFYQQWCLVKEDTPASNSSGAVVPHHADVAHYQPTVHRKLIKHLQRRQNFDTNWRKSLSPRDTNTELNLTDTPPSSSYPPVDRRMKGSEQTLHLMDTPHNDVAVWGIHSFDTTELAWDPANNEAFAQYWNQYTTESFQFLKGKGIKRLILDLSSNSGGMVYLGLDSVRKFFPSSSPFYGVDYRRSPLMDALSDYFNTSTVTTKLDGSSWKNENERLNPPVEKQGDYFTKMERLNPLVDYFSLKPVPQEFGKPPFQLEDVVILTDGRCASTCTLFVEALASLGVPTVVTGGKPVKGEPKRMQHLGGTKGYLVYPFSTATIDLGVSEDYAVKPVDMNIGAFMNVRNSYTADEQTIPQEFIFQPADGHLWYTKEMLSDRTNLWNEVVKLTWDERGNNKLIKSNNNTTPSH